jgi:hypothetical protein
MQNPEFVPDSSNSPSVGAEKDAAGDKGTQADVDAVLRFGSIEDATDRRLTIEAAAFVESPTDNLADIDGHLKNLGDVLTTFMMTGADAPAEIDALHCELQKLFCQHHIDAARAELAKETPDHAALDLAMRMALDSALNLSKGYQTPSYFEEVSALAGKVTELRGS